MSDELEEAKRGIGKAATVGGTIVAIIGGLTYMGYSINLPFLLQCMGESIVPIHAPEHPEIEVDQDGKVDAQHCEYQIQQCRQSFQALQISNTALATRYELGANCNEISENLCSAERSACESCCTSLQALVPHCGQPTEVTR